MDTAYVYIGMPPTMIYAKPIKENGGENWLILTSTVSTKRKCGDTHIDAYICVNEAWQDDVYFEEDGTVSWGNIKNYNFFIPSKKQKMEILSKLASEGYKYVPSLKKLVKKV